jgi:hypothetical protein
MLRFSHAYVHDAAGFTSKGDKMNKKFAALLFALGLGAAAHVVADETCPGFCLRAYMECVDSGTAEGECRMTRIECYDRCGI